MRRAHHDMRRIYVVGTRSLSSGARSRDPLALPTLRLVGQRRGWPGRSPAMTNTLLPREQRSPAKVAMMLAQAGDEWFAPSRSKQEISNAQAHADRRDRTDDGNAMLRQFEPGLRRHFTGRNRTGQDSGKNADQNSGRGSSTREARKVGENFQASTALLGSSAFQQLLPLFPWGGLVAAAAQAGLTYRRARSGWPPDPVSSMLSGIPGRPAHKSKSASCGR